MKDLAVAVRRRARGFCEYCHLPEASFQRSFHIEHVIAKQHGGATQLENLALACWTCNLKKGPNLAGIDPHTGKLTTLFNPRLDRWPDHFVEGVGASVPLGIEILGRTMCGRTTAFVLGMNTELWQMVRYQLWLEGAGF